jgi:ADP-ribosylation factor-like protein 1
VWEEAAPERDHSPHSPPSPPTPTLSCAQEEDLKDAILLLMANKQDMRGALNAAQLSEAMGLATLRNRQWSIQETSATQGKGLFEGFDWLVQVIQARK